MSSPLSNETITSKLLSFCEANNAQCLYAVESGSRAWGFASADSDYDVRFLYIRPRNEYLKLQRPRDVLEYMDDSRVFDFVGWDVIKALSLLSKSNPSIIEWLSTSDVYYQNDGAFKIFQAAATQCFSPRTLALHYLSLGNGHVHKYMDGRPTIMPKRYFYALRAILSARYVLKHQQPAPIVFTDLLQASDLDPGVRRVIDELLDIKAQSKEKQTIPMVEPLDNYIVSELQSLGQTVAESPPVNTNKNRLIVEDAFQKLLAVAS